MSYSVIALVAQAWPSGWMPLALAGCLLILLGCLAGLLVLCARPRPGADPALSIGADEGAGRLDVEQRKRLLEIAHRLSFSLDLEQALKQICAVSRDLLKSYGCALYFLEADGETLRPVVAIDSPYEEQTLATPLHVDHSFTGQAVKARRGLIFNDAWANPAGHWIPGTPEEKEERVLVAPFLAVGRVLGAMCLNRVGQPFTEEDLVLAEILAAYAATALKNAQAQRDLQREVQERRQAEEKFSIAFRSSPSALSISFLRDGRFIEVNDSFVELAGYTREEIIGRTALDLGLWGDERAREALIREVREKGAARNFEFAFRRKSGETGAGLLSAEVIHLAGEPCILAVTADITERNRLQAQLAQAQKLEAVGRLAGAVAHDFNNLLTAIIGNAELFLATADPQAAGRREMEVIRETGRRAAELTRQLLMLTRRQVTEPALLDLNQVIQGMSQMLFRLVGEDVRCRLALDPQLWAVRADLSQIEQLLLNLVVNAREAMPDGGELTIATANVGDDEGPAPGRYVRLSISDTGVGMSPAVQERIWEPFFTTKADGTGLGLTTVYNVVQSAGGHIRVRSQENSGTTFEVDLPATGEPTEGIEENPAPAAETMPRGQGMILLVEDEAAIRDLAQNALSGLGYQVLAAGSAELALESVRGEEEKIDLVISDVILPGMNGRELVTELKKHHAGMRVRYISGYTDVRVANVDIAGGAGFLAKPFTPMDLAKKVGDLLSGQTF